MPTCRICGKFFKKSERAGTKRPKVCLDCLKKIEEQRKLFIKINQGLKGLSNQLHPDFGKLQKEFIKLWHKHTMSYRKKWKYKDT